MAGRHLPGYLGIATVAILFGRVLWRSVPFDLASYGAWAGISLALFALVSLVKPQRWLGIPTRSRAAIALAMGVVTTCATLFWPSPVHHRSAEASSPLDDFLPDYQFAEYHEARTRASLANVRAAIHQVSLADMPGARVLTSLRDLASGKLDVGPGDTTSLLDMMTAKGSPFIVLSDADPDRIILGMAGRPWTDEDPPGVSSPEAFRAFSSPGHVRVAFDLRTTEDGAGGVRLSTETRILGNDAEARRLFASYWRLIYPGSAIIRRVWLDAIIARAERAP